MTKCYKVDADSYKFVHDDGRTAEFVKGSTLAQMKIDAINKSAVDDTELKKRRENDSRNKFWRIKLFIDEVDIDAFKAYLKTVKQKSEVKLQTGRTIFNQQKYDDVMNARQKEYARITCEATALLNNPTPENVKSAQELVQQRKEFENMQILKDDAQFNDPEYVTIRMTAIEALDTIQNKINDYRKEDAAAKQHAIDVAIANERTKFKGISESDFALVKQLKHLMNSTPFFDAFEYNKVWDHYREIWGYDTLEDYFNRERDPKYDSPKLQFSDTDIQAIDYMKQLISDYKLHCESERLKAAL